MGEKQMNQCFIFLDENNGCMSFEWFEHKTTKMGFDYFNYNIENTYLTQIVFQIFIL